MRVPSCYSKKEGIFQSILEKHGGGFVRCNRPACRRFKGSRILVCGINLDRLFETVVGISLRLMVTRNAHIGMVSIEAMKWNLITVILGCSVLVLLRHSDRDEKCVFSLVRAWSMGGLMYVSGLGDDITLTGRLDLLDKSPGTAAADSLFDTSYQTSRFILRLMKINFSPSRFIELHDKRILSLSLWN